MARTGGIAALSIAGAVGLIVAQSPVSFASVFSRKPMTVKAAAWMRGPVIAALSRIGLVVLGGWALAHSDGMGRDAHFLGVALDIAGHRAIVAAAVRLGDSMHAIEASGLHLLRVSKCGVRPQPD